MPSKKVHYKIFISYANDVNKKVKAAKEVITLVNHHNKLSSSVYFDHVEWKADVHADSGSDPQSIINEQIGNKCDIVIAIMKERYGSSTPRGMSGVEEEIRSALDHNKRVLAYCWDPGPDHEPEEKDQWNKLQKLKETIREELIYETFSSIEEFKNKLHFALTRISGELAREATNLLSPTLTLACLNKDNEPCDRLIRKQPSRIGPNKEFFRKNLIELINKAAALRVKPFDAAKTHDTYVSDCPNTAKPNDSGQKSPPGSLSKANILCLNSASEAIARMDKENLRVLSGAVKAAMPPTALFSKPAKTPIKIEESDIAIVREVIGLLEIDAPKHLFYLGKLSVSQKIDSVQEIIGRSLNEDQSLYGSDAEKASITHCVSLSTSVSCMQT